ncbi:hypothetical protein VTI74DRAFT_1477 [Chaetomium olivicolor]
MLHEFVNIRRATFNKLETFQMRINYLRNRLNNTTTFKIIKVKIVGVDGDDDVFDDIEYEAVFTDTISAEEDEVLEIQEFFIPSRPTEKQQTRSRQQQ